MKPYFKTYIHLVTAIAVTLLFSCNNNVTEVSKIGISEHAPIGIGENLNLKYVDSGSVYANLLSKKMIDYSNRDFGYHKFKEGVTLHLYEDKTYTIKADNATTYAQTDLIELTGNVIISTEKKDSLFTEHLYYDQENKVTFNNAPFKYKSEGYITNGVGFDADKNFENVTILDFKGQIAVQE